MKKHVCAMCVSECVGGMCKCERGTVNEQVGRGENPWTDIRRPVRKNVLLKNVKAYVQSEYKREKA